MRVHALLAAPVLIGLASSSCLWGGNEPHFDPERGDELAHAALPDLEDFPGEGWSVAALDEFDEGDSELPADTEDCRRMVEMSADIDTSTSAHRAGRAKIEVSRAGENDIDTEVEVHVSVFEDAGTPREALASFRAYFESAALRGCFEDLLKDAIREFPGLEVETEGIDPVSEVVGDAEAAAFVVRVKGEGIAIGFRTELYAWRIGNAGISVEVAGAEGDVSSEGVEALLAAVQESAREAAQAE